MTHHKYPDLPGPSSETTDPTSKLHNSAIDRKTTAGKATHPPARGDRPALDLSPVQVFAGTAAAVTAALLGSRLGVAGTIVGAALGSVISIVAGALYAHSIRAARYRARQLRSRGSIGEPAPAPTRISRPWRWPAGTVDHRPDGRRPPPDRSTVTSPRRPWRRLVAGSALAITAAFAGGLVVITGIESVSGSSLSGGSGELSVLGGRVGAADSSEPSERPVDQLTSGSEPNSTPEGGSSGSTTPSSSGSSAPAPTTGTATSASPSDADPATRAPSSGATTPTTGSALAPSTVPTTPGPEPSPTGTSAEPTTPPEAGTPTATGSTGAPGSVSAPGNGGGTASPGPSDAPTSTGSPTSAVGNSTDAR